MASAIFNSFKTKIASGEINLASDTIKVMLVESGYSADEDAHEYRDDVTNEASGTGYVSGGEELLNKTVTQDNTNNRAVFNADDVSWAASSITARGAVIYKDTGNSATDPLIAYIDFGENKTSSSGTFAINWSASGVLLFA
jgi:hypothetical protein